MIVTEWASKLSCRLVYFETNTCFNRYDANMSFIPDIDQDGSGDESLAEGLALIAAGVEKILATGLTPADPLGRPQIRSRTRLPAHRVKG